MAKGKAAKYGLKEFSQTRFAKGAGIASAAKVGEELVSNPYAQAALGAAEGAALGAALGPLGAAGGAVAGGLLGFVLADGERIVPIDMIAIPAYQYSLMLQGKEPTFQIYIKEGEVIAPVLTTDFQEAGMEVLENSGDQIPPKKRRLSAWNKYVKNKRNQIRFKDGKLNLKKMAKNYRAMKKGGKK